MPVKLSLSDFRAVRVILEPDDFALGSEEPDPPPSDLVRKKTWHGIMNLPDDVAIRTSDYNGQILGEVHWLWGHWIEAIGEDDDALFAPMLDAHNDLQASIFDALHGYYRSAFSSFRNVIEVMTIGTCGALTGTEHYEKWRNGLTEFKFDKACNMLSNQAVLSAFNGNMRTKEHQSLWDAKRGELPGGFSRRLYGSMCNFAHSRPSFTDGDLWQSNGPIFVANVFWDWYCAYLQTISLCSILMVLARPNQNKSTFKKLFTNDPNVLPPDLLKAAELVGLRRKSEAKHSF